MSASCIEIDYEIGHAPAGNPLVKHPDNIKATWWQRITIAWIRSGQPRPYADSIYEAEICIEGGTNSTVKGFDLPFGTKRNEQAVKQIVKLLVRDFDEDGDPRATWASGKLAHLSIVESAEGHVIWRAVVVEPYTD